MPGSTKSPPPRRRGPGLILLLLGLLAAAALAVYFYPRLTANNPPETPASTSLPSGLQLDLAEGLVVSEEVLTVSGRADPALQVKINGQIVPLQEGGAFELTLRLAEGPNLIIVEGIDPSGSVISLTRQVEFAPAAAEAPAQPAASSTPWLIGSALAVVFAAVVLASLRRRKPWIQVTTDAAELYPGPRGVGDVVTIIVELDRTARLNLYVRSAGGARLTTLLNNRRREAHRYTFTWDGYDLSGSVAAPGKVTVVCEAGMPLARSVSLAEIDILRNPQIHR